MAPRSWDPVEVAAAMAACDNVVSHAALELGVPRQSLKDYLGRRAPTGEGLSHDPSENFTEIPVIHRHYEDREQLYVYPLGDVHKGSPAHNEERWHEWLGYLQQADDASMLGTGDFLNAALKDSKSEAYDDVLTVGQAKRQLAHELAPLAEKIDILGVGNHEDRIYRAVGDCPIEDLADRLSVPYAKSHALLIYHVGEQEYTIYFRHGTGSGGTVGARANRLQKASQTILADAYVSGHTHSQLCFPEDIFKYDPGRDRVVREKRMFISSGSFLNYEEYAAVRGFSPTHVGAPRILLNGIRRDLHVSI